MKDFKTRTTTMTKKTMPKKMLAGATAMVALSGFVPAINAASPTATANVGAEVVIQQAITINVGAPVDFGTIVLSAATLTGIVFLSPDSNIGTWANLLIGKASHVGGQAVGTMTLNQSAGAVNIALGAAPTDNGGNISYGRLYFGGTAIATAQMVLYASNNANIVLIGSVLKIGGAMSMLAKPTPGTYTGKSYTITVTDI